MGLNFMEASFPSLSGGKPPAGVWGPWRLIVRIPAQDPASPGATDLALPLGWGGGYHLAAAAAVGSWRRPLGPEWAGLT